MSTQVANRETYLAELVNQCRKLGLSQNETFAHALKELREAASEYVLSSSFPTTRDEEWRFTDLSPLLKIPFQAAQSSQESAISLSDIGLSVAVQDALPLRLVFVNGFYAPHLSTVDASLMQTLPLGLFVGNLSAAPSSDRDRLREHLSKQENKEVFSALNMAGLVDAAVLCVPKNQEIETPIHLLFVTVAGEAPTMSQPHCLVIAEPGSRVTLVEDYVSIGNVSTFTNAVTEIIVGENASVNHTRIQREGNSGFHIGKSVIHQARDSRYTCNAISIGAKLSRHNLEILQKGEQTETILNGLTTIAGEQLADTHSAIALNYPHGTSRQLHKCIVAGSAHAVFNGKVFVPKAAQLTDAGQLNRNLLLSPRARVDTKPQLEITADNVKCSHGATVSQLDDEEVFYLQSRGLDAKDARNLLINAFAAEIINQLPVAALQQSLSSAVRGMSHG